MVTALILFLNACSAFEGGGISSSISLSASSTSSTTIYLSWSEPGGGLSVSPYKIARIEANSPTVISSTTSRRYQAAGLTPGIRYCFEIRNPLSGRGMSNTACATTLADTSRPSMPSGLTATAVSSAEVELLWNFSYDNSSVAGYDIYRDGTFLKSSSAVAASDTEAVAGATHCYTATAFDAAGNVSAASNQSCASTPEDTAFPSAPTGLHSYISTTDSRRRINLYWTAATDDGLVKLYRVFRNGVYFSDTSNTSYEDLDLQSQTSYCYTIRAVDSVGKESGQSDRSCTRTSWSRFLLDDQWNIASTIGSAIAIDRNDGVHIAYKRKESVSGEYRIRMRYTAFPVQRRSQIFEEGIDTYNFMGTYLVAMAVDDEGDVHLAHKLNRSLYYPEEIQHLELSSLNSTIKSTIQQGAESMGRISLANDSAGSQHACYDEGTKLIYATNSSGAWMTFDADTLVPGVSGWSCDIAIDSDDNIHISFVGAGSPDLMYLSNQSGIWAAESLDVHSGAINGNTKTSIAVDSEGSVHIAYFHDYADKDLEYATNATGSWVTTAVDTEGAVGYDCEIAVGSDGVVHIVYVEYADGTDFIKYATDRNGDWETGFLSDKGRGYMSMTIDSLNNLHLVFPNAEQRLTYMTTRDPL